MVLLEELWNAPASMWRGSCVFQQEKNCGRNVSVLVCSWSRNVRIPPIISDFDRRRRDAVQVRTFEHGLAQDFRGSPSFHLIKAGLNLVRIHGDEVCFIREVLYGLCLFPEF